MTETKPQNLWQWCHVLRW